MFCYVCAGVSYLDNSYSNSNNGGSVNSQDSLWQVKGQGGGDPTHQAPPPSIPHHASPSPGQPYHQYDPMVHGGYGITGYDDYAHYPPTGYQDDYHRNNYTAATDPYAAVHKPRKRTDHLGNGVF